MSYSAVPAGYDDTLESPTFQPPKLQLGNFDFGSPSLSLGNIGMSEGRSRSESKVKSSTHSGMSYKMVDSDTESNYDEGESGEKREETSEGKKEEGVGNNGSRRDQEQEGDTAGSGMLASNVSSPSRDDAKSTQGGGFNGHEQQRAQHQGQFREHDHSAARDNDMHSSQITGNSFRPGLQLDGRADGNDMGGDVSAHHSTVSPRHDRDGNDNHPRSPGGDRGGTRPQSIPPPPPPEFLDPRDPEFQFSASPEDIHPVFRHSQSVPELPPVDVQGLHIQNHRNHRPATSASGVGDLFKDFDGVHFDLENPEAPGLPLRNQPPPPTHYQHRQSQAYPDHRQSQAYPDYRQSQVYPERPSTGSQASSGLVYYPAPVPAMLNLPPTLSKAQPNNRNSRHIAAGAIEPAGNNRRSVAYPGPGTSGNTPTKRDHHRSVGAINDQQLNNRRSLANLPPTLRASQFFDSQLPPIVPDVKEESAVATLDSILDASTRAPAAAFTDHPITGGPAPYVHTRNRSTATALGNFRHSVAINVKLHPGESPRSSMEGDENPDHHNHNPEYSDEDPGSHLNPETGEYYDPYRFSGVSDEYAAANGGSPDPSQQALPTTLLAELESRKAQQRLRNRTAASAFPRGIRSTLLQLDAVAQVQQQHRRTKKTHLAWEEEDGQDGEEKDEDVPLGLLFSVAPGIQKRRDDEVPLGLLMKKEMEDAEPLSKRRERLRMTGGQSQMVQPQPRRMLDVPGLGESNGDGEDEEVEGETLRERMKRLKEKQQFGTGALDMDFVSSSDKQKSAQQQQQDKPEVEETLAQRRRRLQREKEEEEKHNALKRESFMLQNEVKNRRNMADILHVKPMGMATRPQSFYAMQGGAGGHHGNGSYGQLPMQQGFGQGGMIGMNMGRGGYGMGGPGLIGRGAGAMGGMSTMGMGAGGMGMMGMGGEVILDPKQREVVERWRASVM